MPAFRNRRDALARIEALRLQDAVALARKLKCFDHPKAWPKLPDSRGIDKAGFRRLLERELSRPDHPLNWHKRAIAEALGQPRARQMYFTIRRNLWSGREFLTLTASARLILEIVIELARDEAFPWYVNVQAREVNLGIVMQNRGDLDGAEAMYRKSLEIDEKLRRPEGTAQAEENYDRIIFKDPVFLPVIDLRSLAAQQRTTAA